MTYQDQFIKWASSREDIFEKPTVRPIAVENRVVFRSSVQVNREFLGFNDIIAGCGRAESASMSLVKAYAEALERIAMIKFKAGELRFDKFIAKFCNGIVQDINYLENDGWIPPVQKMITSNGWATHFEQSLAIQNAAREAMERHILSYSFFKDGFRGLSHVRSMMFGPFNLELWQSKYSFCGLTSGLVITKSNKHPGHSFGYMVDDNINFKNSDKWTHAILEAVEPLYFFEEMSRKQLMEIQANTKDFLENRQIRYLLKDFVGGEKNDSVDEELKKLSLPNENRIFGVRASLQDLFQMPVNLFASFVYAPSLIPLFPTTIKNEESIEFLQSNFSSYGIHESKIFQDIPVL